MYPTYKCNSRDRKRVTSLDPPNWVAHLVHIIIWIWITYPDQNMLVDGAFGIFPSFLLVDALKDSAAHRPKQASFPSLRLVDLINLKSTHILIWYLEQVS